MSPSNPPNAPGGLTLLGRDPAKETYHWEGPRHGTVWETLPNRLYGWLRPWTDWEPEDDEKMWIDEAGKPSHYLMDPEMEGFRPDPLDEEWALVVGKTDGRGILRIRREFLFGVKASLLGTVEELRGVTSCYAFAGAVMRGEC
ncbi:hypothetical protein NKR19_g9233 [Coniochaeta hoffmannii]|uniref:Uncharacterized protein n=1 Tax=Coniochaeta hoffmannii TaxID=91930 RepID=A0AA38RCV5_9PEZI|nr:hypothetical protein NKR19_g9233 [Coniochaeta hoffmannii]